MYLSNVDGELIGALEDMYGYVDAWSLRACLVGTFSRGNEDYFENGWSMGGDYYVIYNCTGRRDAGTEYENSYVPLDELRYYLMTRPRSTAPAREQTAVQRDKARLMRRLRGRH